MNKNIIFCILKILISIILIFYLFIISKIIKIKNSLFYGNISIFNLLKYSKKLNISRLDLNITNIFINNNKIVKYKGQNYYISNLLYNYSYYLPKKYKHEITDEITSANEYLSLEELKDDRESIVETKIKLLNEISKQAHKSISHLETVFITENGNFGNSLIALNNIIFYCEILGCKNIILNKNNPRGPWHINNTIVVSSKTNLTISIGGPVDCNDEKTVCNLLGNYFFCPMVIRTQIRIDVIKNEILNNLPKVNINPNDVYIHIRSGDVFSSYITSSYGQPPLCFYEKVIKNYKFENIYIIAENEENKIVSELIKRYPNIIYRKNLLNYDIAYLTYAYNIVGSTSSFLIMIIKFNDNLKNLWEYDFYRIKEKLCHLHHHIFKFPIKYNIYTMMPSERYIKEMFHWEKSESQVKLMIDEICPYDFTVTLPN